MKSENILKYLHTYAAMGENVILVGDSGVGKTAMISEVFNANFKHWRYFNGATMNPWVDFVGVPDRERDEETGVNYLTLVQQKDFANDQVEAIFLDELNRAKEKVRNAVMELIQFRSINGKKFNNLKTIWVAINEGEEYDVERLDVATKDRFYVKLYIPHQPNNTYFRKKYGELGDKAIYWWEKLPDELKKNVSPRRLEYAIKQYQRGLPLSHVLTDIKKGHSQLKNLLDSADPGKKAVQVFKGKEKVKGKSLLENPEFFQRLFWQDSTLEQMTKEHGDEWLRFWLPLIMSEQLIQLLNKSKLVKNFVLNSQNVMFFKEVLKDYYVVNKGNTPLSEGIYHQAMMNNDFYQYLLGDE